MAITTQDSFVGDGVTTLFSFTFPYIAEEDVKVSLDLVDLDSTEYSFANATTVSLTTPPANGVAVLIYRDTNSDTPVNTFFPGSSIRAKDLNDNFTQSLYLNQEVKDRGYVLTSPDGTEYRLQVENGGTLTVVAI